MKKSIVLLCFILVNLQCLFAQNITTVLKGTPILAEVTNNVEGSPFLSPKFSAGSFLLYDGKTVVNNLQIKFDVYKDIVSYKDDQGAELVPTNPIKRFEIDNNGKKLVFQNGFPPIEKWNNSSYYEVLNKQQGAPMVLKKHVKSLLSRKDYNSSKVTDTYLDGVKYYVYNEAGELVKLKTDKKGFLTHFANKQNEITEYMSKNNISLKSDEDLGKVFDYYMTINK